jgi:hypothetical protein
VRTLRSAVLITHAGLILLWLMRIAIGHLSFLQGCGKPRVRRAPNRAP